MSRHCDYVLNQWGAGFQERLGAVTADIPGRDDLAESMLTRLCQMYDGSYYMLTTPHTDEDCPFRESDRLPMRSADLKARQP